MPIVEACGISITGFTRTVTSRRATFLLPSVTEVEWYFSVEIMPHPEQCFEAMRRTEDE